MTELNENVKQKFLEKVLIIKHDEKNQYFTETSPIVNKWFDQIQKETPDLIIVCTQNSKSGTKNHFQHWLGKKINQSSQYLLLSKVDAIPISSFLSFKKPYNVRTRIYYNSNNIITGFMNKELSKKSSFSSKNSFDNLYNSKNKETLLSRIYVDNFKKYQQTIKRNIIVSYKMKRKTIDKYGDGIILSIITIYDLKGNYHNLIINNYNPVNLIGNINTIFKNYLEIIDPKINGQKPFNYIYYISSDTTEESLKLNITRSCNQLSKDNFLNNILLINYNINRNNLDIDKIKLELEKNPYIIIVCLQNITINKNKGIDSIIPCHYIKLKNDANNITMTINNSNFIKTNEFNIITDIYINKNCPNLINRCNIIKSNRDNSGKIISMIYLNEPVNNSANTNSSSTSNNSANTNSSSTSNNKYFLLTIYNYQNNQHNNNSPITNNLKIKNKLLNQLGNKLLNQLGNKSQIYYALEDGVKIPDNTNKSPKLVNFSSNNSNNHLNVIDFNKINT